MPRAIAEKTLELRQTDENPDPGAGFRLLRNGEKFLTGDEYLSHKGEWCPSPPGTGTGTTTSARNAVIFNAAYHCPHRRKEKKR